MGWFGDQRRCADTGGMNISNLRRERGWNQEELAEAAAISQSSVSRAENSFHGSTLQHFQAIADALKVPLADLFYDSRDEAEMEVIALFRQIPDERKKLWLEMSRTFAQGQHGST